MQSTIHFFGGARTVTGSNFLLDIGGSKILVDCGLYQGAHTCEDSNWDPFLYDAKDIAVLVVTHAHVDHVGRIPLLVKRGFKGPIISTEATKAIAESLLLDSMELLEAEARRCNTSILYDQTDISNAMRMWEVTTYHTSRELGGGVSMQFLNSGHILGSAMVEFTREGKSLVFTGDLGGGNSPLLPLCEELSGTDYLVMESVYGDKVREHVKHRRDELENVIEDTLARGGTLLIPAFSTERTQDLLFEIRELMVGKRIPSVPVYVDSPLAEKVTESFLAYPEYFSSDIQTRIKAGEHIFKFPELHFVSDMKESHAADAKPSPKIILAGSGMSSGGRVREHEIHVLPDEKSTLLIVGYQAAGSIGRRLVEGAKEITFFGTHSEPKPIKVAVRCHVAELYNYSAHMDGEQLLDFANKTAPSLKEVFVVMGEPAASTALTQRIRDYLGIKAIAPHGGESATIDF